MFSLFLMVSYVFFMAFFFLSFMLFNYSISEVVNVMEFVIVGFSLVEMKFYFYFDYISMMFLCVVSLISGMAFMFSHSYMSTEKNKNLFIFLTFLFVVSMFIMVLSLNSWVILLGWDGLGVVSYFLVIFYFNESSNYSGMITMLTNRLGDVGMIFSLVMMVDYMSFDYICNIKMDKFCSVFIFFFILGSFTKSAQFPFSSWLPLAMAAPTPISALVHSSTLVTAGVYLMVRLSILKNISYSFMFVVLFVTLFTSLMAGMSAICEMDMKKIIAFSTLSQLGLMMSAVCVGGEIVGYFHILTHAMFKALLFFCSGLFIHQSSNNQDIRNFSLSVQSNSLTVGVFLVCSLSLAGFPFLSGFYSKDMILDYFYSCNINIFLTAYLLLSCVLTSVYSLRVISLSLIMSAKGSKFFYSSIWDWMYTALMCGVMGVLVLGSSLSWILVEKLSTVYLTCEMKSISFYLMGISFFFFFFLN